MKRGKGLKADPEKTRAWQQRSRERAARKAPGRCVGCGARVDMLVGDGRGGSVVAVQMDCVLCGGCVYPNGHPALRSSSPDLAVPDVERFGRPGTKRVEFRARTPAREHMCFKCRRRKAHHWHHWSPQTHIRAFVRAERIRELRHEAVLLRRLLRDERNLSPVCAGCHGDKALGASRLTREDVPASAFEFAMEMGAEWLERLRGLYPSRRDPGSESEED